MRSRRGHWGSCVWFPLPAFLRAPLGSSSPLLACGVLRSLVVGGCSLWVLLGCAFASTVSKFDLLNSLVDILLAGRSSSSQQVLVPEDFILPTWEVKWLCGHSARLDLSDCLPGMIGILFPTSFCQNPRWVTPALCFHLNRMMQKIMRRAVFRFKSSPPSSLGRPVSIESLSHRMRGNVLS